MMMLMMIPNMIGLINSQVCIYYYIVVVAVCPFFIYISFYCLLLLCCAVWQTLPPPIRCCRSIWIRQYLFFPPTLHTLWVPAVSVNVPEYPTNDPTAEPSPVSVPAPINDGRTLYKTDAAASPLSCDGWRSRRSRWIIGRDFRMTNVYICKINPDL